MAQRIVAAGRSDHILGENWTDRFLSRHDSIKTKRNKRIDIRRINGATKETITTWFNTIVLPLLKGIDPRHLSNMDEMGVMEGQGINGLCVGKAETNEAKSKFPENRVWITLIECVTAAGQSLPPLVIFKAESGSVWSQWFNSKDLPACKSWSFTSSPSGWTNNAIAVEWLTKIYIPGTITTKKRILIVDGHKSYESDEFM